MVTHGIFGTSDCQLAEDDEARQKSRAVKGLLDVMLEENGAAPVGHHEGQSREVRVARDAVFGYAFEERGVVIDGSIRLMSILGRGEEGINV